MSEYGYSEQSLATIEQEEGRNFRRAGLLLATAGLAISSVMGNAENAEAISTSPSFATEATVAANTEVNCDTTTITIIGHRGVGMGTRKMGGQKYTEDTLPALKKALQVGADGFETDYLPAKTGQEVSNHDPSLNRTTNGTGKVKYRPWRYISKKRADSGARIVTHSRVQYATRLMGGYRQQEMKRANHTDEQLRGMINTNYKYVKDAVCKVLFTASEISTLRRINAIDPNMRVGYIERSGCSRPDLADMPEFIDAVMIDSCAVTSDYVRAAEARDIQVSARGVDTVSEFHRMLNKGIKRFVTNKPEVLAKERNRIT
jgi:glycerophosphoryl diester phosphodiesterase